MSIKRGFVAGADSQLKQAWSWGTDVPPSPFPEVLALDPGDVVYEAMPLNDGDWQAVVSNLSAYYVINGIPVPKIPVSVVLSPATIPADGVTIATISGIPVGTTARVGARIVTVDDGQLELTFDLAGDYPVSLSHPLYLPATVTIHAT